MTSKNYLTSQRVKIFFIIFSPISLLSILFGISYSLQRFSDIDILLQEQLTLSSSQFSAASEYALVFSDKDVLSRLMQTVLANKNTTSVQVFDTKQRLIAEFGNSTLADTDIQFSQSRISIESDSQITSIEPIYLDTNALNPLTGNLPAVVLPKNSAEISGWIKIEVSKAAASLQKYRLVALLLFLLLTANGVFALIALHITNTLVAPLAQIGQVINNLAKGEFSSAKTLKLPKGFFEVNKSIADVAERLENYREEIQQSIEQATEDIRRNMDSIEEKSAQLHIANKEANESNRLKSQFLANISHEVRTPLNAILGYSQILQKDRLDNQQRIYIDTIEQSTNNLLAIIGDILDFSKIEAGKLSLEQSDVNIRDLVDDVFQILSAHLLTGTKQIDLIPDIAEEVPEWVKGDPIRIRQILTNLIGNAIKFTQHGFVRAKVTLSSQGNKNNKPNKKITLLFQVIDSGIGIPNNKLTQLFKPFSQADTSTTRQFGGTGLGLVITKKLVEQMAGKIEVNSELGNGSNFRFSLSLIPSKKENIKLAAIEKTVILYEPVASYRQYLDVYLKDIGVKCIYCTSFEHIINRLKSLTESNTHIDSLILSTEQGNTGLSDTYELVYFVNKTYKIPCILMTQPPSKINQFPELQKLASDVLLKPISHRRLHQALTQLSSTSFLPAEKNLTRQPKLAGLKILAVDDNSTNLQLVDHWLRPNDLLVTLAYSGHQALDMAAKEDFDLILMDIQMPGMDGLETTRLLRQRELYKNTPIIALTAHALGSEQQQILDAGMNAYITKPVNEITLLNVIESWCLGDTEEEPVENIDGIFDLQKSLEIVNGQVNIARDMFTMLVDSLDSERKLILHHFQQQNLKKLIHVVHRIHGASKYCGTPELSQHANFLETHLKELGFDDVDEVLEDFIKAINNLLDVRQAIKWPQ